MTTARFLILLMWFAFMTDDQIAIAQKAMDWAQFTVAWKAYIAHPTSANALRIARTLPYPNHVAYSNSTDEQEALDTMEKGFLTLHGRTVAGDSQSVRLAFRLFSVTDGDYSEGLDWILGETVRTQPIMFLDQLNQHPEMFADSDYTKLGYLVGSLGDSFEDDREGRNVEIRNRIKALRKVKREELLFLRDKCISMLQEMIKQ